MKVIVCTIILCLSYTGHTQILGYMVDREGDTTQVVLKKNQYISGHFNELAFQDNPKYVIGSKKKRVDLKKVAELGFEIEGESYTYSVIPHAQGLKLRRVLLKGNVSVFAELVQSLSYSQTNYVGGSGVDIRYIIRQGNGIPFTAKNIGFKKNLLNKLEPCSAFDKILKGQSFGIRDLLFLIETYNRECN